VEFAGTLARILHYKTSDGTGIGTFTSSITGLTPGATYYVRAYATNSVGTAYGTQVNLGALAILPTITTISLSAITTTTATGGGNVISDGGASLTARGVCWSTAQNPTTINSKTNDGNSVGIFSSSITGLTPGVTYYVRAYAINSIGTVYGDQVTAKTIALLPSLTTTAISSITATTALSGGNISNDGGAVVTASGVCWGTTQNPTISNSKTTDGSGIGSFSSLITGLTLGSTYYVRAYATNSAGTAYGGEVSFKTVVLTVTDVDGNVYSTVAIGTQVWMAENLRTTKYRNGNIIGTTTNAVYLDTPDLNYPSFQWVAFTDASYGRLYTWYAIADSRKVCPVGWHVPAYYEWNVLGSYLGGDEIAGGKMKETGTTHWLNPNTSATNSSGFKALPGGYVQFEWWFGFEGYLMNSSDGYWWTTGGIDANKVFARSIQYNSGTLESIQTSARNGLSVRCVKD